jgi:mono/diheme cytochrome c family protein
MKRPTAFLICILSLAAMAAGAEPVDYVKQIKPILAAKCFSCHGALKQESGLRLDAASLIRKGGDGGPVIVAGKSDASRLIAKVSAADVDERMPPEGQAEPLTAEQIALLRTWIDQGAAAPDEAVPSDPRQHWSYRPVVRPAVPQVANGDWGRNAIDAFIAAGHADAGLKAAAPANKATWLRRVYLDLIGVPPTRDELLAFLADEQPDAFERVVDRLLDSPQYGERWGRHWMDIWRYSDWYGSRRINEIRYSQRSIWRWRDWIIRSLNDDKGYDRMILEMLAADELAADDPAVLPATGYLGRNWYKFDRNVWMFESVERTGEAFLGLTLRCCRCHDHKYDPVSQQDYYRFRAFFEPHDVRTDLLSALSLNEKDATLGQVLSDGIARVYDKQLDAPTYLFARGDNRYPDESRRLEPGVPAALGGVPLQIEAIELPAGGYYPALRPGVRETFVAKADVAISTARAEVEKARSKTDEESRAAVALAELGVRIAEADRNAVVARMNAEVAAHFGDDEAATKQLSLAAARAERQVDVMKAEMEVAKFEHQLNGIPTPAEKSVDGAKPNAETDLETQLAAARKSLESARTAAENTTDGKYTPLGETYPRTSTGRRLALARWIASDANPRTARVAVNHIWGRHFGRPLVDTTENFGLNGTAPSHPQLLDWLAAELVEGGWRMKPLHRLIVLSNTYRMTSSSADRDLEQGKDPENRLLWRMNSRRMEAEVVRDSVLALAGHLDLTLGGPEIPEDKGEEVLRRSLYFRNTPNEKMPLLETFDVADPNSCYRRKESVVPHQALALMNSGLAQDHARAIAEQVVSHIDKSDTDTDALFIFAAFETVLCRAPSKAELDRCVQYLTDQTEKSTAANNGAFPAGGTSRRAPAGDAQRRARENLVHVLLLHNDFVTIR